MKGSRTRFHAADDGLVQRLESVGDYMCEALKDDSVRKARRELELAVPRRQEQPQEADLQELYEELRDWQQCLKQVDLYSKYFERVYRILHRQCFLKSITGGPQQIETGVVSQLILVMVITSRLENAHDAGEYHNSQRRCLMVENDLRRLPRKHKITLEALQTQSLLLIAMQMLGSRIDELWTASGSLSRQAVIMGLHRDGSETTKLSPFESEMRRKLCYTIEELDFQFSSLIGVQNSLPFSQISCDWPSDINDAQLFPAMVALAEPVASEAEVVTDSSYQRVLAMSLPSRKQLVNATEQGEDNQALIEELLTFRQSSLKQVHELASYRLATQPESTVLGDVMVDVLIRRPLMMYYRSRIVKHPNRLDQVSRSDMEICTSHATALLNWIKALEPTSTTLNNFQILRFYFRVFYTEVLRAVSTLLLDVKRMNDLQTATTRIQNLYPTATDSSTDSTTTTRYTQHDLIETIEYSLSTLLRTHDNPRDIFKDVGFLRLNLHLITDAAPFNDESSDRLTVRRKILAQPRLEIQANPETYLQRPSQEHKPDDDMAAYSLNEEPGLWDFAARDSNNVPESALFDMNYMNYASALEFE